MELIQIGAPQPRTMTSVREMFERMAQKEAEMVRAARERMRQGCHGTLRTAAMTR